MSLMQIWDQYQNRHYHCNDDENDDCNEVDDTSDSVGDDFADWSNGPWWVVTTLARNDTKALHHRV